MAPAKHIKDKYVYSLAKKTRSEWTGFIGSRSVTEKNNCCQELIDCGLDISLVEKNLTCATHMIFNLSFFLFSYYEGAKLYPDFSNSFQGYIKIVVFR
jgi:hypothetical protein